MAEEPSGGQEMLDFAARLVPVQTPAATDLRANAEANNRFRTHNSKSALRLCFPGNLRRSGRDYCAAIDSCRSRLADALHLFSSDEVKARPSTRKLSTLPARLARDWQSTMGRLSSVDP